jgi:hypothetical protein
MSQRLNVNVWPKTMTKSELEKLAEEVNGRHTRRALLFVPVIVFAIVALLLSPHSSSHDAVYIFGIIIVTWALFLFLLAFMNRRTRADCLELGARCPKCKAPLFSAFHGIRRVAQKGSCLHCGCELYEKTAADAPPERKWGIF